MPLTTRAARESLAGANSSCASAASKLSSGVPEEHAELGGDSAKGGRTIIDTGNDGCGDSAGGAIDGLSPTGLADEVGLAMVAALTVVGDFLGIGFGCESGGSVLFADS
jgi:hypothetical protein